MITLSPRALECIWPNKSILGEKLCKVNTLKKNKNMISNLKSDNFFITINHF